MCRKNHTVQPRRFIMNAGAPVALISGCSTGIGRFLTTELAKRGWQVFATARDHAAIEDLKAPNVQTAALDVTDEKSIKTCVESVMANAGKIDMLINNAGLLLIGPLNWKSASCAGSLKQTSSDWRL